MKAEFRIEDFSATHVGEVRSENEDSHAALADAKVWLVADGMGGHLNGKFASETIANAVVQTEFPEALEAACDAMAKVIHNANAKIYAKSIEMGAQIGSTFVSLLVRGSEFVVLWSGDSRAYVFRDGELIQLTTDHTQVQAMVDRGMLSAAEALTHPMRHVLARAVGVEEELQIDAVRDSIKPRDLFLLCSDGLFGQLTDDEIAAILGQSGASACDELIERCLETGALDNITMILVSIHEPTLLVLAGEA